MKKQKDIDDYVLMTALIFIIGVIAYNFAFALGKVIALWKYILS